MIIRLKRELGITKFAHYILLNEARIDAHAKDVWLSIHDNFEKLIINIFETFLSKEYKELFEVTVNKNILSWEITIEATGESRENSILEHVFQYSTDKIYKFLDEVDDIKLSFCLPARIQEIYNEMKEIYMDEIKNRFKLDFTTTDIEIEE